MGGTLTQLGVSGTNVKAKVSDVYSPPLEDEYSVIWHLPYENVVEYPSTSGTPQTYYTATPAMTTGANNYPIIGGYQESTQSENGSLEVWKNPSEWRCLIALNGNDWTLGGAALTAGTGLVAYYVPGSVIGAALPATAASLGLTGTALNFSAGPSAPEKVWCTNNSAQWQQAIREARDAANGVHNADTRVDPPGMLNGYTDAQLNDTDWSTNPLWNQFKMTPWIKRTYEYHFFKGDAYDNHGYAGGGRSQTDLPTNVEVVGYYTYVGTPSNP